MKKILNSLLFLILCLGSIHAENNSTFPQLTNIPTVYIQTKNRQDITSKDIYLKGIVTIVSENGSSIFTDSIQIKGRGNASWSFPKKPYRMKLYNKANLLGMPAKAKDWTLINNYGDKTLMRNLLAFDLSNRLEMPYSPAGKPVDVYLNNVYKGCYQLCDQIEVGQGRVEVEKMDSTDISGVDLTGGYLVELDAYASTEALWFSSKRNGIPVTIKYPNDDEITGEQINYIKTQFNAMESALYTNRSAGISKYIDKSTFLRQFLVGEFSGNTDTYWSTYMYKHLGDEKFYFGPVWDFDIAYENDSRTYPINNNPNWIYATTGSTANGVRDLVNHILSDASMMVELKNIWANYRSRGIIKEDVLLKVVDDYASEMDASQKLNFKVWNIMNQQVHMNPVVWGSYAAEVNNVKNYISKRIVWMDYKLEYDPTRVKNTEQSKIFQWVEANTLYIKGLSDNANVQIFDLTGRNVQTIECSGTLTTNLERGCYIVRISDREDGNSTLKCIIP